MKFYFKILNLLTIIAFTGILLLPSLNEKFNFIENEPGHENKTKAAEPDFDFKHLDSFVKQYDTYYTDIFNLRNNYIKLLNQFEYFVFGVSAIPKKVVIGKDGWFYDMKSAPNYKAINLFTKKELLQFRNELNLRTKWAAKRGIKYYLAIVPNKMNIYPEHLPDKIIKLSKLTRYDQIVSLANDSLNNIIDLKATIIKHKNDGYDLYQHTDDHWNELGAFFGYEAIMNRLQKDFPELTPFPLSDFQISIEKRTGDLTKMTNLEKKYSEQYVKVRTKQNVYGHDGIRRGYTVPPGWPPDEYEIIKVNENGKKLKCLVIRDSFTALLMQYFQEHFRETIFIHGIWRYQMHADIIQKEQPDVILTIALENYLDGIIENPFTLNVNQDPEEKIHLKASNGKFLCNEQDHLIRANRENPNTWETYIMDRLGNNKVAFHSYDNKILSAELKKQNEISATRTYIADWETFTLVQLENNFVALKAANGKYLSLDEISKQIFAKGDSIGKNEKFLLLPE